MQTQHGPQCDVCGRYITIGEVKIFRLRIAEPEGLSEPMYCHGPVGTDREHSCEQILRRFFREKDYTILPQGPIRKLYEHMDKEGRVIHA